jgi:hypothetical protein
MTPILAIGTLPVIGSHLDSNPRSPAPEAMARALEHRCF